MSTPTPDEPTDEPTDEPQPTTDDVSDAYLRDQAQRDLDQVNAQYES